MRVAFLLFLCFWADSEGCSGPKNKPGDGDPANGGNGTSGTGGTGTGGAGGSGGSGSSGGSGGSGGTGSGGGSGGGSTATTTTPTPCTSIGSCASVCSHGNGSFTTQSGVPSFVVKSGHRAGVTSFAACQAACEADPKCASAVFFTIQATCTKETNCGPAFLEVGVGPVCFHTTSGDSVDAGGKCTAQFHAVTGTQVATRACSCPGGGSNTAKAEVLLLGACGVSASCNGGDLTTVAAKLAQCGPDLAQCIGYNLDTALSYLESCGLDRACATSNDDLVRDYGLCQSDALACVSAVAKLPACGLNLACLGGENTATSTGLLAACGIQSNCAGGDNPLDLLNECTTTPGATADQLLTSTCGA